MEVPRNMKELYTAIRMFGSYRAFIYGFALIASPLTSLTCGNKFKNPDGTPNTEWKRQLIKWGPKQDQAYKHLKAIIASPPVLAFPDFSLRFYLYMDASKIGFAFAIHQRFPKSINSTCSAMELIAIGSGNNNEWQSALEQDKILDQFTKMSKTTKIIVSTKTTS